MTSIAFYLFWIGISVVFYTYVGYAIVIYFFSKLKRSGKIPPLLSDKDLPAVTLLIAAYNEEDFIREKIRNTFALDYPSEKLVIFFVTDGSTDRTPAIIQEYPRLTLFHEGGRRGKIHAVNRVMKHVTTPLTVFCDANTYLNQSAIKNIARHFQDDKVGGVAGEKRIFKNETDNASGAGEGMYWQYESFLKRKDAEVYSIVGAAGELFAVRTDLYEEPEENMIIEDFYMSLRVAARGYRFAYEPDAYATETASSSVEEEWKRKVRICAGAFQAMARLSYLLNPFRYGILSFQYFSHRVLRWTLAPLFLPLILVANLWLALNGPIFYGLALLAQIFFYVMAWLGYVLRDRKVSLKGFFVPYYFAVMNAAVYAGFLRHLKGNQSVMWDKAKRAQVSQ